MATFDSVIRSIPGLTHYYPLDAEHGAKDVVGGVDGTVHGGVTFAEDGAHFDGSGEIELGDSDDFSVAGTAKKELSIVVFQTVDDWTENSANGEYVHWMGKGRSGAHEWVFRYYIDGGGGEAAQRRRRTSYYNFNPDGGLGTGSYFQDEDDGPGTERVITGVAWGNAGNGGMTQMWKNGEKRDQDELSDYDVYPENTDSHVFLGSRGDGTGNLVGRLRRVAFFDRRLTEAEIKKIYDSRDLEEGGSGDGGGGGTTEPDDSVDVLIGGASHPVDGLNVDRDADQLIVYSSEYGSLTGTNEWGYEVKVVGGKVAEVMEQRDQPVGSQNMSLDDDSYVLSGHGSAREWLVEHAKVGAAVGFSGIDVPEPEVPTEPTEPPDLSGVEDAYAAAQVSAGKLDEAIAGARAALDAVAVAKGDLDASLDALGEAIDSVG